MSRPLDTLSQNDVPAGHKLLSRTVADWLAARIISGESPPGERLTEPRLAELAGVSRSPVREALRLLASEGLVDIEPRLGAHVAHVGANDARELYACRALLEPPCASAAVAAITPAGIADLDVLRQAMETATDGRQFLDYNVAYFRSLTAHCPNQLLREFVALTWTKAQRYWSVFARLPGYSAGSLEYHARLHDAVHARDPAVAEAADRALLERALLALLSTFEAE